MTARKTAKKTSARKPTAKTAKTAAKKKAPASTKSKTGAAAKKPATKRAAKAPVPRTEAPQKAPAPLEKPSQAADTPRAATSSLNVNLGHVFGLRPRVSTSFRQADFHAARQRLQDESYASLPEAARAVAEKALELTHEGGSKRGGKSRR